MGVFPQNLEISRSKLINLWIAEYELLHPIELMGIQELKSFLNTPQHLFGPEVYAAVYLEELAINYLVTVYQRSTRTAVIKRFYSQGIKTCGLHSSWWHLCHREAKKTKVFYIVNSRKDAFDEEIKGQKTLAIHNNVLLGIKEVCESVVESCTSSARSLLCFGPYLQYPVPICYELRLLQRLDALNIRFYEFPLEVTELVELKYLALTCNEEVPPSISKLWKLQFLIVHQRLLVKCSGSGVSYLPKEIWDMQELRHLEVMGSDLPSGNCLPHLSELLHVSAHSCTDVNFVGLPNLRKLGIRIELAPDGDGCSTYLDHVSYLERLESLKCVVANPEFALEMIRPPSLSILPSGLKKLALNGLGYPWEEMSKIGALHNLEVLKLQCNAFRSPEWDLRKFSFKKLEHLLIEDCDLEKLVVGSESLMKLEYLKIKHCYTLEEFIWESESSVRSIELVDSNPLLEKQIKKVMRRGEAVYRIFSAHSSWIDGKPKSWAPPVTY